MTDVNSTDPIAVNVNSTDHQIVDENHAPGKEPHVENEIPDGTLKRKINNKDVEAADEAGDPKKKKLEDIEPSVPGNEDTTTAQDPTAVEEAEEAKPEETETEEEEKNPESDEVATEKDDATEEDTEEPTAAAI